MCGFIGCVSSEPISYSDFNKVNKYIVCRGPDRNIFFNNENKEFRFVIDGKSLSNSRLFLLKALSIVIKNGMSILGVSTPKAM